MIATIKEVTLARHGGVSAGTAAVLLVLIAVIGLAWFAGRAVYARRNRVKRGA